MPITQLASCPVCGGADLAKLPVPRTWISDTAFAAVKDQVGLSHCRDCSFEFVNPRPGAEHLNAFYSGKEYTCHRPTDSIDAQKTAEFLVKLFEKYQPPGRRFLDYGCGGGWLLRYAVTQGWDGTGFDVGGEALESTRKQGMKVIDDPARLPKASYDLIILNKVFEHVPDMEGTLANLKTLLAPGGLLFIDVPNVTSLRARLALPLLVERLNFDERHRAFPIHLSYFSPRTIRSLVERNGYDVRACETYGFGIEELVMREESTDQPYVAAGGPKKLRPVNDSGLVGIAKKAAKTAIKRVFFGAGLGENLLVVASPT